jgi:hypothetical protein
MQPRMMVLYSWAQVILSPQSPEWLGLQLCHDTDLAILF